MTNPLFGPRKPAQQSPIKEPPEEIVEELVEDTSGHGRYKLMLGKNRFGPAALTSYVYDPQSNSVKFIKESNEADS